MVGKLTWYRATSSIVCALMGHSKFFTKNDCLKKAIDEKNGELIDDYEQTAYQEMGDALEGVCIQTAAKRLGMGFVDTDITDKVEHRSLKLEASLDGIGRADGLVIEEDVNKGIYLPRATKLELKGAVVFECKTTREFPQKVEPPLYMGVLQLFSSMEICEADYGVLCVLYNSNDLRTYVYQRDPEFAEQLKEVVEDFDRRIDEEDWYAPETIHDAYIMNEEATEEETLILTDESINDVDELIEVRDRIAKYKALEEQIMARVMVTMGNHSKATSKDYTLNWGMRNYKEQKERVIPAKEAYSIRLKQPQIKVRASES